MRRRAPGPAGALACTLAVLGGACGTPSTAPPPAAERAASAAAAAAPVGEATCTTAPLKARVLSLRQDSTDSVRIEVALSNLLERRLSDPHGLAVRAAAARSAAKPEAAKTLADLAESVAA